MINSVNSHTTKVEIELLLCCVRTYRSLEVVEQIGKLLQQDIDWVYLIQTASYHGVMPLLYHSLKNTYPETVPQNILKQLREYFHINAINNLYRTQELHNLLNLLDENKIPAIPFKGPVLAALAYGNLSLRQFADLDILIHKQDAKKVRQLLISQGYQLIVEQLSNPTEAEEAIYLQSACEYNFLRNDGRVAVEPHWGFAKKKLCISFNPEPLWQRLQEVSVIDKTVCTFSVEDSLLIACINGTKDYWNSLKTICDVAELIRAHQAIDWEALIKQARIVGCQRILFLGLFLAHDLLGADLPKEVCQSLQTDAAVKLLANEISQRLFTNVEQMPQRFGGNFSIWDIRVRERLRDKVYYCFNLVFSPNEGDAAFLPLPQSLHFIYPLVRQFRLIARLTRLI